MAYYWGEAPEVDEFKVKVIPDNAAKILALRNGEIDAILGSSRLSAEGYTEIYQDAAFGHAMDDSTSQTRYLGMNLNKAPFNDPHLREAISYAVNQQELETSVFDGLELSLIHILNKHVLGYRDPFPLNVFGNGHIIN